MPPATQSRFRVVMSSIPKGPLRLKTRIARYKAIVRRHSTPAERHLWVWLRGGWRHGRGYRFKHPMVLNGWVVSFYNTEHRVAVIVGSGTHPFSEQTAEDCQQALAVAGIRTLILADDDVEADPAKVVSQLMAFVQAVIEERRSPSK